MAVFFEPLRDWEAAELNQEEAAELGRELISGRFGVGAIAMRSTARWD